MVRKKTAETGGTNVFDGEGNVVATLQPGTGIVLEPGWHLEGDEPAAEAEESVAE